MNLRRVSNKKLVDSLTDLLVSISLEGASLAHITNAQTEIIQYIDKQIKLGIIDTKIVSKFQKSVTSIIKLNVKMQILLQFKLEKVLENMTKQSIKPYQEPINKTNLIVDPSCWGVPLSVDPLCWGNISPKIHS